jgi:16S rRNA processing protein RimM
LGTSDSPRELAVGIVGRAVGLRGEVEVEVYSDDPARFARGSRLGLQGSEQPLTLAAVRRGRERTVVRFEEVTDRTGAQALRGAVLVVPSEAARALGPHEFWDHDLVGCEVVTATGEWVGTVAEVLHTPANDVLVVGGGSGEHLVPLIRDAVRSVEPRVRITLEPMPGLLGD